MKLYKVSFKLAEELLEVLIQLLKSSKRTDPTSLFRSTGKTEAYLKPALRFLKSLKVVEIAGDSIMTTNARQNNTNEPEVIIKDAITKFEPFTEFLTIVQSGKSKKLAAKRIRAIYSITNEVFQIESIFDSYSNYIGNEPSRCYSQKNSEKNLLELEHDSEKARSNAPSDEYGRLKEFVHPQRIQSLRNISNTKFDTSKLVKVCEEMNYAYNGENYITVGVLLRVIMDHVPPIFEKKTFAEVANNFGPKSFKDVMTNLENFQRKIADGFLHSQIRKKEILPTEHTIDCRNAVDVLLAETISELS